MRSIVQVRDSSAGQDQVQRTETDVTGEIHKTSAIRVGAVHPTRPHILHNPGQP